MKKKAARNLVLGDQLVMVRDGSYNACFKSGDRVSFQWHKNSQKMDVLGLWEGRELAQTIDRKDVELYKQTPCDALGYKIGDMFEVFIGSDNSFSAGSIVELVEDDGSNCPRFKLVTGRCGGTWSPFCHCWLESVKPHTPLPQTSPQKIIGAGPEPLEAELYCVVAGDTDRMCTTRAMTLLECQKKAERMCALFPEQNYRVMRLVPHDNNADVTVQK